MGSIRSALRSLLDSPVGDRLRKMTGYNPTAFLRPMSAQASISDLIPWRCDDVWNTRFDLLNLPSLLFPEANARDEATIVFFDADGAEITRQTAMLEPFETKTILLDSVVGRGRGAGTFACFHRSDALAKLKDSRSYVFDRQYVGFKREGDKIWGFAHGNISGLAMAPGGAIEHLAGRCDEPAPYRVQCRFDDCDKAELVYPNYSDAPKEITVSFLAEDRSEIARKTQVIPPRGVRVVEVDNRDRSIKMVEHRARIAFWRPVVFKHYQTHYNVFHS